MRRALSLATLFVIALASVSAAAGKRTVVEMVTNLNPQGGSWPSHVVANENRLYFAASADHPGTGVGTELYRYINGRVRLAADVRQGPNSSP